MIEINRGFMWLENDRAFIMNSEIKCCPLKEIMNVFLSSLK